MRDAARSVELSQVTHWEGEPVQVWRDLWGLGSLEIHSTLGSTNERAADLTRAGAGPWSGVLAEEQVGGKGRGGRAWFSPFGAGVWLSLVAPARAAPPGPAMPLRIGLAAARAIERVAPTVTAQIKWPNDIMLGGRKVGGILCESVPGVDGLVVVGLGVNVSQVAAEFPESIRETATSLALAAGGPVSRAALVGAIVREVRRILDAPAREVPTQLKELRDRDLLWGRRVSVSGVEGRALGIAGDGALLVDSGGDAPQVVRAGSITLLD